MNFQIMVNIKGKEMISEYTEYLIEYDLELLMVYLSGLTTEGYWEEIREFDDVNDPESFSEGYASRMRDDGLFVTVEPVFIEQDD